MIREGEGMDYDEEASTLMGEARCLMLFNAGGRVTGDSSSANRVARYGCGAMGGRAFVCWMGGRMRTP